MKNVCINIDKLIDSELALEEFIFVSLIKQRDFDSLTQFADYIYLMPVKEHLDETLKVLESNGWIQITGDSLTDIYPMPKFLRLLDEAEVTEKLNEIENWVQEYRLLFKDASNKEGIMGDRSACIEKLKRFIKKYPTTTKEQIIDSAIRYINTCKPDYRYLQRADYFVFKTDNTEKITYSRLAAFLEDPRSGVALPDKLIML